MTIRAVVTASRNKQYYAQIENPENLGFSFCGRELRTKWVIDLPANFNIEATTIGGCHVCPVCGKKWKENIRK